MPVFYETKNFTVDAWGEPHVSRTDGGHIIIRPKSQVEHRWQFDPKRATELIHLSMVVGEAMLKALNKRGILVERINFQDNGNWAVGTKKKQHAHLHLYGRSKNSKHQKRGEALYFPDKKTKFWKKLEPLNADDIKEILKQIKLISKKEKYKKKNWKL